METLAAIEIARVAIVINGSLVDSCGNRLGSARRPPKGYRSILPEFVPIVNDDTPRFGVPLRRRSISRNGRRGGLILDSHPASVPS